MKFYPAIFSEDNNTKSIAVNFPDIPEAITFGNSTEDAYAKANEVLSFALEDYKKLPIPTPTRKVVVQSDNENVVLIPYSGYKPSEETKTIRKNITIPSWLNDLAIENNVCFSKVMTKALKETLNIL